MKTGGVLLAGAVLGAAIAASCSSPDEGPTAAELASAACLNDVGDLYQQRIAPLLATDRPKTCNQCHLSGVDLSLFVRDDMCETRACLLELGLVNPENPDDSVVLSWIQRAQPESDLITQDVIDEEYEGFKEFVERLSSCGGESCAGVHCPETKGDGACGTPPDEPDDTIEVPAGTPCDDKTIEATFLDTVYVWRDRCFPCHFSNQTHADPLAPRWIEVEGGCEAGSLKTFHNLVNNGDINVDNPSRSFLLLKPLGENEGGVEHGGGEKFGGLTDPTYLSFLSFVEYYSACMQTAQLP